MSRSSRGLKIPVAVVGHRASNKDDECALLLQTREGASFEVPIHPEQLQHLIQYSELDLELWGKYR